MKKIVIGHYQSSYGNVRKKMKKGLSYSEYREKEFSNIKLFDLYIDDRVIALDACTVYTKKVNIYVIED